MKTYKLKKLNSSVHYRKIEPVEKIIATLISLGFSDKHVIETVGVTRHQIAIVRNKTNIKRKDYRDGTSEVAKYVSQKAKAYSLMYVKPKLLQ